jgi:hypothetical protein
MNKQYILSYLILIIIKLMRRGSSNVKTLKWMRSQEITVRLRYHKFCATWVPKMLTGARKTQRMASAFVEFLKRYQKIWRCIAQSHRTSNRWWNLGCLCECWNQRAVKTHSPNKPNKFKQTSACHKADVNCFQGQVRSADGGISATRDRNNVTSVLGNTK